MTLLIILSSLVYADYTDPTIVYDFEQDPSSSDLIDQLGNFDSDADQVRGRVTGNNSFGWDLFSIIM
jgi:hypothetical protein